MENLKYTEILQLNKSLAGTIETKPYRIGILSNVTINSIKEILEYNCRIHQVEPLVEIGNFDNIVQDSAQSSDKDLVIIFYEVLSIIEGLGIVFDDISDEAFEALQQKLFTEIDMIIANLQNTPALIFNLFSAASFTQNYTIDTKVDQLVQNLNQHLCKKESSNLTLINTDKIIGQLGIKQAIDFRFYYSSKAPYTVSFFKEYVLALQPVILRNNGKLKKALIFDCDNTLWKGILGEDGLEEIDFSKDSKQGKFYYSVQQLAAYYSKLGIVIGLCSKNNPEDVEEVLHQKEMALNNDSIVIKKVNWQDKATNLRILAQELNIGTDSLVFVDDSPFEINLIKEQLPEILTLQVPANISDYPTQLQKLVQGYFNLTLNKEDLAKTEMYKQQSERESVKQTFATIDDYLASLEIVLSISENDKSQIPRIAQLTQKTNQFNLTTQRYTEQHIEQFMNNPQDTVFSLSVKDKFGDSGLTGMCIALRDVNETNTAIVDTLLMSCRIIGRNIEYVFFNQIVRSLREKGFEKIKANFKPTKKNDQVATFYEQLGMKLQREDEDGTKKHYYITISEIQPKVFDYIRLE
jgi:FkbH-like protein